MFRFMILVIYFGCVSCHFVTTPKNVAVLAGERTNLECRATKETRIRKWIMRKPNNYNTDNVLLMTKNKTVASFGPRFAHFCAEVDDNLSAIIYINSTKLEDGGNYTCELANASKEKKSHFSAQLIVLESLPDCKESQNGNSAELQCTVIFRGFWAPVMEWSKYSRDGTADNNISMNVAIKTVFNSNVTSTLTVEAYSNDTHVFYSCKIFFRRSEGDMLIMNATNVPDFVYIWNSSTFNISPQPALPTMSFERSTVPISDYLPAVILGLVVLIVLALAGFIHLTIKRRKRKGCTNSPSDGTCGRRVGIDTPPCPTTENIPQYQYVYESLQERSSTNHIIYYELENDQLERPTTNSAIYYEIENVQLALSGDYLQCLNFRRHYDCAFLRLTSYSRSRKNQVITAIKTSHVDLAFRIWNVA